MTYPNGWVNGGCVAISVQANEWLIVDSLELYN